MELMELEALMGYFQILHTAAVNNLNPQDEDDLKDAIVIATFTQKHFTDEQLDRAVKDFNSLQNQFEAHWQKYVAKSQH